jgi:hypothetical protein
MIPVSRKAGPALQCACDVDEKNFATDKHGCGPLLDGLSKSAIDIALVNDIEDKSWPK